MDFPISAKFNVDATHEDKTITYDTNVFAKEYNKTKKVGKIKPKTYFIRCNGNGHMDFILLEDPINTIKKLFKLKDDEMITDKEFEEKKKELLDRI